ncbi:bacteriocin [Oculatella sp. LEGE 06141]|uniref:bacteriocin n=1 Tax=Oculatella sp. LEGE 06141 TaxID=1828648 RepID=UPI0018817F3D|nr:bacteriocin [Oculatella sp. LEGE 06141]MBE9181624.1 bacteriocin [Oculatella sp. LEGE 06141]
MASINVSNLHPAGSELFCDSESFLNELTDEELTEIEGGYRNHFSAKIPRRLLRLLRRRTRTNFAALNVNGFSSNNSINGQTMNAQTVGNENTVAP